MSADRKPAITQRSDSAELTLAMQALQQARYLYIQAQNPRLSKSSDVVLSGGRRVHAYDKDFLMQFNKVCTEMPFPAWDSQMEKVLGSIYQRSSLPAEKRRNLPINDERSSGNDFTMAAVRRAFTSSCILE